MENNVVKIEELMRSESTEAKEAWEWLRTIKNHPNGRNCMLEAMMDKAVEAIKSLREEGRDGFDPEVDSKFDAMLWLFIGLMEETLKPISEFDEDAFVEGLIMIPQYANELRMLTED